MFWLLNLEPSSGYVQLEDGRWLNVEKQKHVALV